MSLGILEILIIAAVAIGLLSIVALGVVILVAKQRQQNAK
jgi:hypothetical protein